MADTRAGLPQGRYGRAADEARTNRRLSIVGGVLGVLLLGFVGWAGYSYIAGERVTGELTGFEVVSDERVDVNVALRKPSDGVGVCTIRAQAEDGLEVGRADFTFDDDTSSLHRSVTLRTTQRATAAELISCSEAPTPR
ncbi:DUF4307 domain-containing protein [Streptomyces hainanensis]|uniref:DUF4307 domain-containing protein n=1 Tax=Streptomyces hainanensis TaxID=402648 RepID=A0A4R4T0H9_9ACTN|nr:DUF4307 domain-containing protein [Streptomyces hainanensis]TDC70210.1 DUF4307 domain-containing protein [Streptomyces hainanensis]